MEFKTCEEYVLSLLEENQNEIAHQEEVIRNLNKKIGDIELKLKETTVKYDLLKDIISRYGRYYHYNFEPDVFKFEISELVDPDRFNLIHELIPEFEEKKCLSDLL